MTKNVGSLDAGIRAVLGIALLIVSAAFNDRPLIAIGSALIALVFFATALTGSCPLYRFLGINTCRRNVEPNGI